MGAMPSPFALPYRFPTASLLATLAGVCAVAGCAKMRGDAETAATGAMADQGREPLIAESVTLPDEQSSDEPERSIRETPLGGVAAAPALPVPVKSGTAPLVYLVDAAQVVQVIDETAGVILAELPVPGRTIVRVDGRNGVIVGKDQAFAGPLPEGRQYGIYVVPDGENVSRAGRFMPRPTRTIATPPAAEREGEPVSEKPVGDTAAEGATETE